MVRCPQILSLGLIQHAGSQQPLVWRLGAIIDLVHPGPVPGLMDQLHIRLEEVNVETGQDIDTIERLFQYLDTKADFHRGGHSPREHISAVPVDDGHL